MRIRDEEVFEDFRDRFRGIDASVPNPPPFDGGRLLVQQHRPSTNVSLLSLILAALVVIAGAVTITSVGRPPKPSPSLPGVATGSYLPQPTSEEGSPFGSDLPASSVPPVGPGRQRIDVVNGPRQVLVYIDTDLASWEWAVSAGATLTLLDEPVARPGVIQVADFSAAGVMCQMLDTIHFEARSFTIILSGPATGGHYAITVHYKTYSPGQPDTHYEGGCSG